MFSAEIARIRKLGVQGVSHCPDKQMLTTAAAIPSARLSQCYRLGIDDVEGTMSNHKL
jgi:hypothetical protein